MPQQYQTNAININSYNLSENDKIIVMYSKDNGIIRGVVENMAWYESKTGEREYVFGQGGGPKLADELRTELLGQLPLGQPDWTAEDFAPSIYAADHPTGKIYLEMAAKVIGKLAK